MSEYTFVGVDKEGKRVTGQISAPSEGELRMILRGQGVRPVSVTEAGLLQQDIFSWMKGGVRKVSTEELSRFTRQLHVLITSGIPLLQSLEILIEQLDDKQLKNMTLAIKEKVSGGMFFWEALSSYSGAFPKIYYSMIRAGEISGSLDVILDRLATFLEAADKINKEIKGALFYPVMVLMLGLAIIFGMLIFVIPTFQSILQDNNQELPMITQSLISLSDFMVENVYYVLFSVVAVVYLAKKYWESQEGRSVIERVLFRMPLFGPLMQKAAIARFCRTLGTLLSSGVTLMDAIDIAKATVNNVVMEEAVSKIRKDIEEGKTMSSVLSKIPVFPSMLVQMVRVGESTGSLDKMLDRVAGIYESEVESMSKGLGKLIEPALLIFLGSIVAAMLLAMYLPVFKLAGSAGGM